MANTKHENSGQIALIWDGQNVSEVESFLGGQEGPEGVSSVRGEYVFISTDNDMYTIGIGEMMVKFEGVVYPFILPDPETEIK